MTQKIQQQQQDAQDGENARNLLQHFLDKGLVRQDGNGTIWTNDTIEDV